MCSKWPAYVARSLRQIDNQRLTYAPLLGNLTCGGRPAYCRTVTSDHHPIPKSKINVASPACIVRLISLISRCSCSGILSTFSVPKRGADFSAEPHQHTICPQTQPRGGRSQLSIRKQMSTVASASMRPAP